MGVATLLAATLMRITDPDCRPRARALYHSALMRYLLALDQGTTSSRALLFDEGAVLLGMAQEEHPQIYPEPGWVEHDPELLWQTQVRTARRVLAEHGICGREIAAIGISNQRETTLLWDRKSGRPLANAIVWQDRRTAPHCERLRGAGLESMVRDKTGLLLDPYFSATKLAWLLAHLPGARRRAERGELCFGTVDSYLLFRLTGGAVHATDVSNASRTLLFDIHTLAWDEDLLRLFEIPPALLPEVWPNSHLFGATEAGLFGAPIPIAGMAGDQQAATFGQACVTPGLVKNTYGTGSFLLMNTGEEPAASRARLLTTIAWQLGGKARPTYALEGSIFVTGAAVQWLRDALGLIRDAAETEVLARSIPDNDGVYLVPAFVGLGAPYWDPEARGILTGITRGTGRAHLARAVLEAACYQTRDVVLAMQADAGTPISELRVDGGMTRNDFFLQLQADLLGIPVVRPTLTETTALGAAYLAGLTVGVFESGEGIAARRRSGQRFEPALPSEQRDARYAGWRCAVAQARLRP